MDKTTLAQQLTEQHQHFIQYIQGLTPAAFMASHNNKWTAGQQLEHILLSVKPVRQVMGLPLFLLAWAWGKNNRTPRSYEAMVQKYQSKLASGGVATARFLPRPVPVAARAKRILQLNQEVNKLCKRLAKLSDKELDTYLIPHPLLGKLTIREMLFFTLYHVQHHDNMTRAATTAQENQSPA